MKGQRLYIRPSTSEDRERLESFYSQQNQRLPEHKSPDGLIGFLVGEIVADLRFHPSESDLVLDYVWVDAALRRKRIGRAMTAELVSLARKLGATRLVVRNDPEWTPVFLRLGFRPGESDDLVYPVE